MRIIFNVEIICEGISLVRFLIQVVIMALWLMVEIRILQTHKMVFVWVSEHAIKLILVLVCYDGGAGNNGALSCGRWLCLGMFERFRSTCDAASP